MMPFESFDAPHRRTSQVLRALNVVLKLPDRSRSQLMPPKKPPPDDGKTLSISAFFKPDPKSGRPAKKRAGGRPSTLAAIVAAGGGTPARAPSPSVLPAASSVAEPDIKKTKTRANYDVEGPAKARMDAAVHAWMHLERPTDIATGLVLSSKKFAEKNRLPPSTFAKKVVAYVARTKGA